MLSLLLTGIVLAASNNSQPSVQFAADLKVQGATAQRLGRAYDRITSPPLSDPVFTLSDVSFDLTRRFIEYSGDISGRTFFALEDAAPLLGRKPEIMSALIAGFAKYQKPDGHFGADQQLDKQINQERDMPILWGNGRLLFALARYCQDHQDPKVLAMARKLGDYMCSTHKYYGKEENFKAVGGVYASGFTTCYPSMIDGLVALADVTGDKKYADEARFIAKLSLLDDSFDKHHSHGRFTTYRGMLDLDYLTGTRDFVDKVRAACAKVTAEYELPTGGITEVFNRDHFVDEGCTEADWLWVQLLLWRATGEASYLDHAEHILRNHVLAAQFPNGGFGHWWLQTLKDGDKPWYGGGFKPQGAEAYWCCAMHGTMALAEAARYAIVARDGKVVVTWLGQVEGDLPVAGGKVHVDATRTGMSTWQIRVRAASPTDVTLRLRVPAWARKLSVDGKELAGQDGWLDVARTGVTDLSLDVTFPEAIRLEGVYSASPISGEPNRIFVGRDMCCLLDAQVRPDLLPADAVPTILLSQQAPDGKIRAVLKGKDRMQEIALIPLADRNGAGCRQIFHVEMVTPGAFAALPSSLSPVYPTGKLVQLVFACDGECEIYLNGQRIGVATSSQQELLHTAFTERTTNVVTVRLRSKAGRPGVIGLIRAGGKVYVTNATDWTATKAPTLKTPDWMIDAKAAVPDTIKLDDLGAWGVNPWKHVAGQFFGTGAHWIWPADYKSPGWCTVRYAFTLP